MKIHFLSQTKLGKWAVGLAALWPVATIMGMTILKALYADVLAGNGLVDDLRVRPVFAMVMLFGIACGVASFPASLVAIFRQGERSLLSIFAALLGLFLTVLLLGEIFVEH